MDSPQARDNAGLAFAILRIMLGLNIFMHGVSRILSGQATFVASMTKMFQDTILPVAIVVPFGYALPWLEAVIGLLILIGLRTREALVSGAVLMLVLTFGTVLRQDWNAAAIQLFYCAIYAALIANVHHNKLAVDEFLFTA
ncbi:MAG TPA: DoxX family protein [Candidatus Acidoferrales bacterium]|nr:DoxX family protein [Candidatus Acidoferrales bacterium]